MNRKALQIILYSGIFSTAYAGFFYQKHVDASVTHDTAKIRPGSSRVNAPLKTAALQVNTFKDSSRHQISSQYDTKPAVPSEKDASEKGRRMNNKIKIHAETRDKTSGHNSSSFNNASHDIQPDITSAATSSYQRDYTYNQDQTETTGSTDKYSASTTLAYTTNPVTYSSTSGQTRTAGSTASMNDSLAPASTNTTSDIYSQDNSFNENTITGDGSEFLPDGSSQQDLVDSLSKKPRVYTIEDYHQADISCTTGYGAPTAHAQLMYGLKGC
jgi:hypothetical protein